jgi:hypothetical protein
MGNLLDSSVYRTTNVEIPVLLPRFPATILAVGNCSRRVTTRCRYTVDRGPVTKRRHSRENAPLEKFPNGNATAATAASNHVLLQHASLVAIAPHRESTAVLVYADPV